MFEYHICNQADKELFEKQCLALEKNVPEIVKQGTMQDVDGSLTQIYRKDGAEITVCNSVYIGALYIESEIELDQFFET